MRAGENRSLGCWYTGCLVLFVCSLVAPLFWKQPKHPTRLIKQSQPISTALDLQRRLAISSGDSDRSIWPPLKVIPIATPTATTPNWIPEGRIQTAPSAGLPDWTPPRMDDHLSPSLFPQAEAPKPPATKWRRPENLLRLLDQLNGQPTCTDWCERVRAAVQRLVTPFGAELREENQALLQLRDAYGELDSLLERVDDQDTATTIRRAGHALLRRLDVWQPIHAWELASRGRSPHRQTANVTALEQTGLAAAGSDALACAMAASLAVGEAPSATCELSVDLTTLIGLLEEYEESGRVSIARQLVAELRRGLQSADPAELEIVQGVERHYRNCNFRLAVTEEMLNDLLPPQENRPQVVRETVLGVPTHGVSQRSGDLRVRLVPNGQRLSVALESQGIITASTSSRRGAVTFLSRGATEYQARKLVELGKDGWRPSSTVVSAKHHGHLHCLCSDYDAVPFVGTIVRKRVTEEYCCRQPAASAEVERKVVERVRHQLDSLAETRLESLDQRLTAGVLQPLEILDLSPAIVETRTDEQRLTLRLRLAGEEQLAANTPRPRAWSDSLLSVQLHQSLLNNVIDRVDLDGRSFELAELREWIGNKLQRELAATPSATAEVRLTFAAEDAVRVRCQSHRLELQLALAELSTGHQSWRDFVVYLYYRPQAAGADVALIRDGVIELSCPRLSLASELMLRGVLSRAFSNDAPIHLPIARLADGSRRGNLKVTQFTLEDGWIGLALGPIELGQTRSAVIRR